MEVRHPVDSTGDCRRDLVDYPGIWGVDAVGKVFEDHLAEEAS